MIKEKLLNNILICKDFISDIEKEVEKIYKTEKDYIIYYNCNKDKINRSRIIISEKLLEVEKTIKEHKQEVKKWN